MFQRFERYRLEYLLILTGLFIQGSLLTGIFLCR